MRVSCRRILVSLALVCSVSTHAAGQDQEQPPEPQHVDPSSVPAWSWTTGANLFFGYNYQQRKYADFYGWESQNWGMLSGRRPVGRGVVTIESMLSLEPFTIPAAGSPQLFQTGESYQQVPLVNAQHPHDLLMELGASYRVERGRVAYLFSGALVGSPALGPTAFMHRESAANNPQAPISHHSLDSTHITPGVVTFGVASGPMTVEASVFRGEEPDENRTNVERPKLNSWSTRLGWRRGPWNAQVSGGRLHDPEWFEPYMTTRLTASIGFTGTVAARPLAATVAWGENRENNGYDNVDDSYLVEWDYGLASKMTFYGRAEHAKKQVFGLGLHPAGFTHPHFYSTIDAATLGVVFDLPFVRWSRAGIGADVTAYPGMSPELSDLYQGSHSYHFFVRWRPTTTNHAAHVH